MKDEALALVKKNYRSLSLLTHPDRGGDEVKFKALGNAYAEIKSQIEKRFETKDPWEDLLSAANAAEAREAEARKERHRQAQSRARESARRAASARPSYQRRDPGNAAKTPEEKVEKPGRKFEGLKFQPEGLVYHTPTPFPERHYQPHPIYYSSHLFRGGGGDWEGDIEIAEDHPIVLRINAGHPQLGYVVGSYESEGETWLEIRLVTIAQDFSSGDFKVTLGKLFSQRRKHIWYRWKSDYFYPDGAFLEEPLRIVAYYGRYFVVWDKSSGELTVQYKSKIWKTFPHRNHSDAFRHEPAKRGLLRCTLEMVSGAIRDWRYPDSYRDY